MNKHIPLFRPEENALLIWNLALARTAYISGEEIEVLRQWGSITSSHSFINKLKQLGLVSERDKPAIKAAIDLAATKKAPRNSFCAPESIHIELTSRCPLSCPQCYKDISKTESTPAESDLPLSKLLEVIHQAAQMQVFQIALGGGEPLVYPHLATAIKEIAQHGMASSITTSGAGLTSCFLATLKNAGLNHIQISLNGSINDIHALSRDGFHYGRSALKLLQNSGLSYGINWVARADNIHDFPALASLAKAYQVQNLNILRYKPSPIEPFNRISPSAEQIQQLAQMIKNTKGLRLKLDSAFSNLRCKLTTRHSFMSGCGAGRRFLALSSCGAYLPCSHVAMKEVSTSLHDTWYHSKNLAMFRNISSTVSEPCSQCRYLHSCYGCRAVVLGQGDDFNGGDKSCSDMYLNQQLR